MFRVWKIKKNTNSDTESKNTSKQPNGDVEPTKKQKKRKRSESKTDAEVENKKETDDDFQTPKIKKKKLNELSDEKITLIMEYMKDEDGNISIEKRSASVKKETPAEVLFQLTQEVFGYKKKVKHKIGRNIVRNDTKLSDYNIKGNTVTLKIAGKYKTQKKNDGETSNKKAKDENDSGHEGDDHEDKDVRNNNNDNEANGDDAEALTIDEIMDIV
jgi:hypothetical protein